MAENLEVLLGDCREVLPTLEAGSVQCCVTSPPYWGLRDYGTAQWEGGDEGCEHKSSRTGSIAQAEEQKQRALDRGYVASSNFSNYGERWTDGSVYRSECGKCGARRIDSQLGLEAAPEEYIANMVAVFREVWRVLRDDGTLWLNLGDSYAVRGNKFGSGGDEYAGIHAGTGASTSRIMSNPKTFGLKEKDLCMMPARLAMALQADGWYLRSDIIWHKPNPMPESVTDRPTKAHEYIFLLTKAERYFYDAEAIREPADFGRLITPNQKPSRNASSPSTMQWGNVGNSERPVVRNGDWSGQYRDPDSGRNKRSVWTIATQPFSGAHFATFPEEIPKLCILAGSKPGDTILDPFAGSGTVGQVALELGRRAVLIELNPAYIELARERTLVTPGFF